MYRVSHLSGVTVSGVVYNPSQMQDMNTGSHTSCVRQLVEHATEYMKQYD